MSIRKIARLGHPILRKMAEEVPLDLIQSSRIQQIIIDMKDTVLDSDGAGLAAPQIHESFQIVLIDLDDGNGFQVWINPKLTPTSDDITVSFEGCLSVPDMRGAVSRYAQIKVEAYNEKGEFIEFELEDFPATVAQHEHDHLLGILYTDHTEPGTLAFFDEYKRYKPHLWSMMEDGSEEEAQENPEDESKEEID
jgi:peptide deformylase